MLMRTDPFREFDRLAQSAFAGFPGTWSRPSPMPMDAYRRDDQFVVEFDLPGVDLSAVDLSIERNVLTVKAERRPRDRGDDTEMIASERAHGVYSRQLFLGDNLDTDRITAHYDAGVLTVRIPVAERAKPRSISIEQGGDRKEIEV